MKKRFSGTSILGIFMLMMAFSIGIVQAAPVASVPASVPIHEWKNLKGQGFFYVGGDYVGEAGKEVMRGQMYVDVFVPKKIKQQYPIVFYHGAGQTATNWLGTPDGRKGWAEYFVDQGYVVYLVDQPARGRSAYHPDYDGKFRFYSATDMEKLFSATEQTLGWPGAEKHTQWPGVGSQKGLKGDPIFDAFYATQVESIASDAITQSLVQKASAKLLDKIGPAIIVTHSQAGHFGWLIADSRPNLVKGIIAMEPSGQKKSRPWGITDIPITYDPPLTNTEDLVLIKVESNQQGSSDGWLQQEPARQLVNLRGIPIMIMTGEASYHMPIDHWTSEYLTQAGVKNTYIRLSDYGIHGNGHMLMMENNNLEVATLVDTWIKNNIK